MSKITDSMECELNDRIFSIIVNSFENAVTLLLSDTNFTSKLIENGKKIVKRYSWSDAAKKIVKLYEKIGMNYS